MLYFDVRAQVIMATAIIAATTCGGVPAVDAAAPSATFPRLPAKAAMPATKPAAAGVRSATAGARSATSRTPTSAREPLRAGVRPAGAPAHRSPLPNPWLPRFAPGKAPPDATRRADPQDVAGEHGAERKASANRLREVFEQAQEAESIEHFTQLLRTCEQALRDTALTTAQRQYGLQLAAWLYNKRGEAYSAQAEGVGSEGENESEQALERNALHDFDRAIALYPAAWRPFHNRGVSYAILQQYQAALDDFAAALERNPRYVNTWFNRGEVYYELGQYERAAHDYAEAVRLNPQDVDALANRGHAYFQLGDYQRSLADYDQVLQLRPEDALAYVDRADTYAYLGHWSKAAADYRVAIRLDNRQARAYQNAAWLMATCPVEEFRNPELAIRAARRAIELAGASDHRSLDILGAAQASAGQFREAEQAVAQALHSAPVDVRPPLKLRLALYQRQQPYRQPVPPTSTDATLATHPARASAQAPANGETLGTAGTGADSEVPAAGQTLDGRLP